ncbi:MAG: adenosylmethionine decarboxylase [Deltaproteobacteria bacterium]|nr:adenosylmethionine decarboxylase [Deltaproteobacteria bacterium]
MKALGKHLILELYGCPSDHLDDLDHVARVLTEAVEDAGATLIKPFFHRFAPQGVSGVAVIAESHFSIHTWPEYAYAAVDMFTCGDCLDLDRAFETIRTGLAARQVQKMEIGRGMLDVPVEELKHKPSAQPAKGLRRICRAS